MRQVQKMESVGQLTGGVAHDFNNLLTVIIGNLDALQRHLREPAADIERLKRSADNAMRGARRGESLTQRLLAFSRQQPLEPRPVDIGRLVAGMSDLLRRTFGEQIAIETALSGGLWQAEVDPNQLEVAILNLAVNARDAMPDGGKLTLETANVFLDQRLRRGPIGGRARPVCPVGDHRQRRGHDAARCRRRPSIRSSRPRTWARAPASASARSTASSSSRAGT